VIIGEAGGGGGGGGPSGAGGAGVVSGPSNGVPRGVADGPKQGVDGILTVARSLVPALDVRRGFLEMPALVEEAGTLRTSCDSAEGADKSETGMSLGNQARRK